MTQLFFLLQGQVAYVLTQETDEFLLWNPLTGQCHKQFDPFCPLQSVDCLFDDGNVSIWEKNLILHYLLKSQTVVLCPGSTFESCGKL